MISRILCRGQTTPPSLSKAEYQEIRFKVLDTHLRKVNYARELV
jgi:hypothetical protein